MNMEDSKDIQEIKLKVKKYLELENVSVLAGAGTSFHLGAPSPDATGRGKRHRP